MAQAQRAADEIDRRFPVGMLERDEFGFDALAREYFGHVPPPRRSGRRAPQAARRADVFLQEGHAAATRPRPQDALKAALASVERKKQQALQKDAYVAQLTAASCREIRAAPDRRCSTSPTATRSNGKRSKRRAAALEADAGAR